MKKILIALVAVVIVGVGVKFFTDSFGTPKAISQLSHLTYTETFTQTEPEYFVYFYQDGCSYCEEFEPFVMEAAQNGVPVYVIDAKAKENLSIWYDWEGHHNTFTKVIGDVRNGVSTFYPGEEEAMYPKEEGWEITQSNGQLMAVLNTPQNNTAPQTAEELEISGTPTLLRVKDGRFAGYAVGTEEGRNLLNQFNK